jgi:hypothetical protein
MENRFIGLIVCLMTSFTPSLSLFAQTTPPGAAKIRPDLSGFWDRRGPKPTSLAAAICGPAGECGAESGRAQRGAELSEGAPMYPWAEELRNSVMQGADSVQYRLRDDKDPKFSGCMPSGPTRLMNVLNGLGSFEIRQFPDAVFILFEEDHWVRRIYTDGREHPDNYPVTWMGHSIGKWDGDTLVVDTVKISEKTMIDSLGHPHSDAYHLVERIRRPDRNTMELEFTVDDPKAYTKPWSGKRVYELQPPGYRIFDEVVCEELLKMGTHYSVPDEKVSPADAKP